jgi:RND family efflux transporter MFP subunit
VKTKSAAWAWLSLLAVLAAAGGGGWYAFHGKPGARATAQASGAEVAPVDDPEEPPPPPPDISVRVVRPKSGDMDRTTTQPGTVQSYEFANLYSGASGYLKAQTVDIGDRVKKGQVLATVDVPDLEKSVQKCSAGLEQAKARVTQTEAHVTSARADLKAAEAGVLLAEANAKSKAAELRFRQKQLDRMKELFASKSIDERLVDEHHERRDAAQEAERAARAAIANAEAQVAAMQAKIQQAQADVVEANAEVNVAKADLEKAQVMVRFATIVAPFDGVVTRRSYFPGDYVRSATESGSHLPLLTVDRTDRVRVVVEVPDRDVPYTDPGDLAFVDLDAIPGETFRGKVSRIAGSEDPGTRLMHVEIDLPNPADELHPNGKIHQGMYGRAKIILEKSELLSVPSSCLSERKAGNGAVFVVRDGHARRVAVKYSEDNGIKVGILSGLKPTDEVVMRPEGLTDGAKVVTEEK